MDTSLLKWVIKNGVIIFIIAYPIYLFRSPLKKYFEKTGLWVRKNILKKDISKNKKEEL